MKFLLALLILALPVPDSKIDKIFRGWNRGPGGSVGVVVGGRLVFARGYGLADVAKKTPNTPQTVYDLASVSKQFTATAVLLQAQQGKLTLTDRLDKHISGLPAYAAGTSLERLLTMTSGFPEYDDSQAVKLEDLRETLRSEPGTLKAEYQYLNMNYALLTFVVQKVAGQPLGEVLQQDIFRPLKMGHTTFLHSKSQRVDRRAIGYKRHKGGWVVSRNDVPGVGDGNVFSSVEDLSLWAIDWLRGSSLLKPEWQRRAWTRAAQDIDYGFGFEIDEHQGQRRISHSGSWNGTSTYIALYPQRKLAVIVLSNREEEDSYGLGEQVEDLFLRS